MNHPDPVVFITLVQSARQKAAAQLLIESLRAFGGAFSQSPMWIFEGDPDNTPCHDLADTLTQVFPLEISEAIKANWFAPKVSACAQAESMAAGKLQSLVWIASDCLVIQPPTLFDLGGSWDIALRPVHIQNVGLLAEAPLDVFWNGVYQEVGVEDARTTLESFVDQQHIRAYYNSHMFAVDPALGLLKEWHKHFAALVTDQDFQARACQDDPQHIFLHQAVLSALIDARITAERVCILPPTYSYPYNLQRRIPPEQRAQTLNELVCIAYEERPLDPAMMDDILVNEPLRRWLGEHVRGNGKK
jgi:hypothetical protein